MKNKKLSTFFRNVSRDSKWNIIEWENDSK